MEDQTYILKLIKDQLKLIPIKEELKKIKEREKRKLKQNDLDLANSVPTL